MAPKVKFTNNGLALLNIGCGLTYHPQWNNLDIYSTSSDVVRWDLKRGIPYVANSFDAIYVSHVLEHFSRHDGTMILRDCFRALKSSGIIRIVVPDLESIAREYLLRFEGALSGAQEEQQKYEWIVLELLDQMVRNKSGGEMLAVLKQEVLAQESYVLTRIGQEAARWRQGNMRHAPISFFGRMKSMVSTGKLIGISIGLLFGARAMRYYLLGRFRSSGEVHQWMYDRYSLVRLLELLGFENSSCTTAVKSQIPDWNHFQLDCFENRERKPDSIYMEAFKPCSLEKR